MAEGKDEITINDVISKKKEVSRKVDTKLIMKAYNLAAEKHKDQTRGSGEPYIIHPLNVAYILASIGMDENTLCAALLHDVGKTKELSSFPLNDYTDEGQLLGHIIIGAQMIHDLAKEIPDFPEMLENQLVHCILAHHGELEYGSPKKPALAEAVALNLADNTDARMETLTEIFAADKGKKEWLGYNRLFESNLRRTGDV